MICHVHSSTIKLTSWHHHVTNNDDDKAAFRTNQKQIYWFSLHHLTPCRNHFSLMHTWTVGFFVIERHTFMTRHVWEQVKQKNMNAWSHIIDGVLSNSCDIVSTHCVCAFSLHFFILFDSSHIISIPSPHISCCCHSSKVTFLSQIFQGNLELILFLGWRNCKVTHAAGNWIYNSYMQKN